MKRVGEGDGEPVGAVAFASPGYGLTLLLREHDHRSDPARPRDWLELPSGPGRACLAGDHPYVEVATGR